MAPSTVKASGEQTKDIWYTVGARAGPFAKRGHNVLLTDADNIFMRYQGMEEMETSELTSSMPTPVIFRYASSAWALPYVAAWLGSVHRLPEFVTWNQFSTNALEGGMAT